MGVVIRSALGTIRLSSYVIIPMISPSRVASSGSDVSCGKKTGRLPCLRAHASMNLAILHYHLNRGGVASVIANQVRAIDQVQPETAPSAVALVHGGRCAGWSSFSPDDLRHLGFSQHTVAGLDYDDQSACTGSPQVLAARIQDALGSVDFHPQDTLLHVHNHALGKNRNLPEALRELARAGYGVLLQLHDFAEDFRPDNYRSLAAAVPPDEANGLPAQVYPQGSRIHYAVLNRRDRNILARAGFPETRLHYLPNIVQNPDPSTDLAGDGGSTPRQLARRKLSDRFGIAQDSRFLLYPVRGIRRKNLGEMLLWSILAGSHTHVGITLAPLSPVETRSYHRWKQLSGELNLPCVFELGGEQGMTFGENLRAADMILTTSVAEGFGLVFLECWLANRSLIGRDLPEITIDFREAGIQYDGLGGALRVPVEWVGQAEFCEQFGGAYQQVLTSYALPVPSHDKLVEAAAGQIGEGMMDFASLPVSMQVDVIDRAAGSVQSRSSLKQENAWMARALETSSAANVVRHNATLVRERYSPLPLGRQLCQIYRTILAEPPARKLLAPPQAETILPAFLSCDRFQPLRVET